MKLLSIAVPSYNSQDYLERCLDTLVVGGPEIEIIIVDDGSTDNTADIAYEYQKKYPELIHVERKANGGHGSAVNRGLSVASGVFFKVVDSDDWVEKSAYLSVLDNLRKCRDEIDLLITNYVYEYFYNGTRHTVQYQNVFPQGEYFEWEHTNKFKVSQLLLMHSMIYRTELLRQCGLKLPEHTFYVDNIVAYQPLPYVKKMMYIDVDFYRYFIGRPDQSVNTTIMIKRIDQQLLVNKLLIDFYRLETDIKDQNLRSYMYRYLTMMMTISVVHLILSDDKENFKKIPVLWDHLKRHDQEMYRKIRHSRLCKVANLPGRSGRMIAKTGFYVARKIYKFS